MKIIKANKLTAILKNGDVVGFDNRKEYLKFTKDNMDKCSYLLSTASNIRKRYNQYSDIQNAVLSGTTDTKSAVLLQKVCDILSKNMDENVESRKIFDVEKARQFGVN